MCAAVEQLLAEHQRGRPGLVYSVETQAAVHYNRVFAGKQSYGRTPTTRVIYMEDILGIVKSSFQCMYVQVGTLILRQVHGTAIGSQLSPVLSHMCVARHEVIWQRIYGQWFTSHNIFLERYVDNRFVIFPSPASGHPAAPLEALFQADFYGAPIVLEQVGSSEFLGFVIDVGDRAIYYKTPSKIWQIRGPRTAGSLSTLLSGARSRSALATKYAHPARAVQMALDQLRSIYLSAGYKLADLQHLFSSFGDPNQKEPLSASLSPLLMLGIVALLCLFSVFLRACFGSSWLLRSGVSVSLWFLVLDFCVDHGAHSLVQPVLAFSPISESCSLQQQYVRSWSLAESSRPRALTPAGVDEVNPPCPVMLNSVNSETPTDPPPHVGFQSLQLHADHRHNVVVNPKSLSCGIIAGDTNDSIDPRSKSPMVHDYVGQPGIKKANIPRSIMDKKGTDRRRTKRQRCRATSSEIRTLRNLQHVQRLALQPRLRSLLALASPESLPEPPAHAHSDAGNPGTPPEVPRAWTEEDDQQLCSLKADSRSKYSYKSAQPVHRGCHAALEESGAPQESAGTESEGHLNLASAATCQNACK